MNVKLPQKMEIEVNNTMKKTSKTMVTCTDIVSKLSSYANPENVKGMARFGINPENTLGIPIPVLRKTAKEIGRNHELAGELWAAGIHEARILACFVDDHKKVTEAQMESWAGDFDSWDVCDQCCMNLFDKTPYAVAKAVEWSASEETFVKRAGFAIMASLAFHDKKAGNDVFISFLKEIKKQSGDDRNFVKKAVNWALRQIGKRNRELNRLAVEASYEIQKLDSKAARWIAADAIRELTGDVVQSRLKK
jgi:3-methyladenine DNA glycosylase AlkD